MRDRWDEPVRLLIGGVTHLVFDDTRATEILLIEWPDKHGPHHRAAQDAILRSMRAEKDPVARQEARLAFATAAHAAGILASARPPGNRLGYHLVSDDGSETFTTNGRLAQNLSRQGWIVVGYLALPLVATEAMVKAGEHELATVLSGWQYVLPENGMRRVLTAALTPLNEV
jgi:hypothetical protein